MVMVLLAAVAPERFSIPEAEAVVASLLIVMVLLFTVAFALRAVLNTIPLRIFV